LTWRGEALTADEGERTHVDINRYTGVVMTSMEFLLMTLNFSEK
jgi:hypothetical protein